MPLWKKIFLRSLGFGVGLALTLCIAVAVWVSFRERPKPPRPWVKLAVVAQYDGLETHGADNYVVFDYALQNNTDDDLRLNSDFGVNLTAKLQKENELAQFSQTSFTLKYPVFVPARNRVALSIKSKLTYPGAALKANATHEDRKQYRAAEVIVFASQLLRIVDRLSPPDKLPTAACPS